MRPSAGNMAMSILLGTIGLFSMAPAIWAAGPDCKNAEDQATMTQCADQDFNTADARLNATYRQLTDRLRDDVDKAKLLVTAEKAWIALRNADCAFQGSGVEGGNVYPMIVAMCRTEMTDQRVETLRDWLNCKEGDLSCPSR